MIRWLLLGLLTTASCGTQPSVANDDDPRFCSENYPPTPLSYVNQVLMGIVVLGKSKKKRELVDMIIVLFTQRPLVNGNYNIRSATDGIT